MKWVEVVSWVYLASLCRFRLELVWLKIAQKKLKVRVILSYPRALTVPDACELDSLDSIAKPHPKSPRRRPVSWYPFVQRTCRQEARRNPDS